MIYGLPCSQANYRRRVAGMVSPGSPTIAPAWGARDPLRLDPVDRSNDPGANILLVRQWLRAGRQVSSQHRIQLQAL